MVNTQRKAISPVVATALLLVVAVVAVVGFQTWFNTYQSENFAKLNEQTATGSAINFQLLENDTIYLTNSGYSGTVFNVTVEGCNEVDASSSLGDGLIEIDLSGASCSGMTDGASKSIRVRTDDLIYPFTGTIQ